MQPLKFPLIAIFVFYFFPVKGQNNTLYTYQELSKTFYTKQKDSIRKAWICPDIYKNKATQKKYKEIWDSRTDFITDAIDKQDYVYEPEVFTYVQNIVKQITQANSQLISTQPFLLIDRSSAVNAYALGGNIIIVNLGLIDFVENKEELAFAVAHELSHNILNHAETAMKERAELLTSDEYKESLNSVLDSKYERFTRLRKVLENYSFDRSRHQRYHEADADSLALLLLQNSKIAFKAEFFLRLDSADLVYKQPLLQPLKDYFTVDNLPFEEMWAQQRTKGLSTRNYSFKDTSAIEDSLKTHPDCAERYQKTLSFSDTHATLTPLPASIKAKVNKMLIWNIYDNMGLTACLYRILLTRDEGVNDPWYHFMLYNIFNGLYYNDRKLNRFNAIGITSKEYISKDYYALQNMLQQMPRESLVQYCGILGKAPFWEARPADEKALRTFLYTLANDEEDSDKIKSNAAHEYVTQNSTSMYCEFAEHFLKK